MTRRYREPVEMLELRPDRRAGEAPAAFRWRGRTHRVREVLGHWREDAAFWTSCGVDIPQRDLWRVEATGTPGVCELVHEGGRWRISRVWD